MKYLKASLDSETDLGSPPLGLIVLQSDETLEFEAQHWGRDFENPVYVSRIPSASEVSGESLAEMETDIKHAASLLPSLSYRAIGYGCTSASAIIGSEAVERQIKEACNVETVTNPLRALTAKAESLELNRFALVSPYVEEVNTPLRKAFARAGLTMDVFGSFGIASEHDVVRISTRSLVEAGVELGQNTDVEAVFLSCTNLRTIAAIPAIERAIRKPVLSSNSVLFWHMTQLAKNPSKINRGQPVK